jgi:hypothetical protein
MGFEGLRLRAGGRIVFGSTRIISDILLPPFFMPPIGFLGIGAGALSRGGLLPRTGCFLGSLAIFFSYDL